MNPLEYIALSCDSSWSVCIAGVCVECVCVAALYGPVGVVMAEGSKYELPEKWNSIVQVYRIGVFV